MATKKKVKKILMVGGEAMPFAATGGLGDVLGSLPASVKAEYGKDADIRLVMPLYSSVKDEYRKMMELECVFNVGLAWRQQYCGVFKLEKDGVVYYFIDNEYYFKRPEMYGNFDDGLNGNLCPIADFSLLKKAYDIGNEMGLGIHVGNLYSTDVFYNDDSTNTEKWSKLGVLAVEMEAAALYMTAQRFGKRALAICTVSDHLITGESTSSEERQTTFTDMMKLALEVALLS